MLRRFEVTREIVVLERDRDQKHRVQRGNERRRTREGPSAHRFDDTPGEATWQFGAVQAVS